jgi:hypothetical protein
MLILRVALYVTFGVMVGLAAGTPAVAAAEAASGPLDAVHEVMTGDNLHLIAGYYYGDARQWERIWAANKAQVKNPNLLERGMLLVVPNASAPDTPYPEFAARTRREAALAAAAKAEAAPAAPEKPEKEVRIMGESTSAAPAGESIPPAGTPAAGPPPPAGPRAPGPEAAPPAKAQPRPPAQ